MSEQTVLPLRELSFSFITDRDLRDALRADYRELQTCLDGKAWKAVHVLSGSLVEAVLVDYLISTGYKGRDPLRMSLGDLIEACAKAGALSKKTKDLSSVIQSYRNLIHPGRAKRLNEAADQDGAEIAAALV